MARQTVQAVAFILVLGCALNGCGGASEKGEPSRPAPSAAKGPQRYSTVEALKDAAVKAGYECESWEQDNVVKLAAESGHCSDADVFSTFASEGDLQQQLESFRGLDEMGADYGIDPTQHLVGPNWIINSEQAPDLADELGGTVVR